MADNNNVPQKRVKRDVEKKNTDRLPIDLIKQLAKAQLHLHLDGSLRLETILELAKEQGVALPSNDIEDVRKIVCIDETCSSLEEYLKAFAVTVSVLQEAYALTRVMYEVCEDAHRDGISYIEVRFSPVLHTEKGLPLSAVMEAVCEGRVLAEKRLGIVVRIIVCGLRHLPVSTSVALAELCWRYRHRGVVAFDLAGAERGFSSKLFVGAFDIIRAKLLNVTLHAGEGTGAEYVHNAIRYCGATRIGHGCGLAQNDDLLKYIVNHGVAIECCPTSNVQTKTVESISKHPLRKFFDAGAVVCLSTDNNLMSQVTLSEELFSVQNKLDFTVSELVRLIDHSFAAAFLPAATRRRLRIDAFRHTCTLLQKSGYDVESMLFGQQALPWVSACGATLDIDFTAHQLRPLVLPNNTTDTPLSVEQLRKLPKTDLHCRLDGALSATLVYNTLCEFELVEGMCEVVPETDVVVDILPPDASDINNTFDKHELPAAGAVRVGWLLHRYAGVHKSTALASSSSAEALYTNLLHKPSYEALLACRLCLQHKKHLQQAAKDVVLRANEDDGVVYMEIVVRPTYFTSGGLSEMEVVQAIVDGANEVMNDNTHNIRVGVMLYANVQRDDPVKVHQLAQLTMQCMDNEHMCGVVTGFGLFGTNTIGLSMRDASYYRGTLDMLKDSLVDVTMSCGGDQMLRSNESVVSAVHIGGASRLSGAYRIHEQPEVIEYLAQRSLPIEIGLTPTMELHTNAMRPFMMGHPLRMYLDANLMVTLCSFRATLHRTRCDALQSLQTEGKLKASHMYTLLANGFRASTTMDAHERRANEKALFDSAQEIMGNMFLASTWTPKQ